MQLHLYRQKSLQVFQTLFLWVVHNSCKDVDWVIYAKCLWTKCPFHGHEISPDPHL